MPSLFPDKSVLDELIVFARLLPRDPGYYDRPNNQLRAFLLDLADCYGAVTKVLAERKAALEEGRKQNRADHSEANG